MCANNFVGSEYEKEAKPPKVKVTKPTITTQPVFTKKENATLAQRIEVINWYHKNSRNQSATARHFAPLYPNLQIKQPLVSSWIKEEEKWQKIWEETNHQGDRSAKRA